MKNWTAQHLCRKTNYYMVNIIITFFINVALFKLCGCLSYMGMCFNGESFLKYINILFVNSKSLNLTNYIIKSPRFVPWPSLAHTHYTFPGRVKCIIWGHRGRSTLPPFNYLFSRSPFSYLTSLKTLSWIKPTSLRRRHLRKGKEKSTSKFWKACLRLHFLILYL